MSFHYAANRNFLLRYALAVFAFVHGLCHLPGFGVYWQLLTMREPPYKTTILPGRLDLGRVGIRACGLVWLALPEARWGLAANLLMLVLACAAVRSPGASPAINNPELEQLWNSAPASGGAVFDPQGISAAGRSCLQHAIAPGTALAASARLSMHG